MADFLSGNGHHERAAQLLVKTKQIEEALDMCMTHNVLITEDMAEAMTPQKLDNGTFIASGREWEKVASHWLCVYFRE